MRVLIIRNSPDYMSIKNNTYNIQEIGLARALVKKGHICDIVFWADEQEETIKYTFDDKCINIFYKRGIKFLKNALYPGLDELIKKYDVVQVSEYNQIQSWFLAGKYPDKTVVYHGPYYAEFNRRYRMLCRLTDLFSLPIYKRNNTKFITKSDLASKFLLSKGIAKKNIDACGVGIDEEALKCKDGTRLPTEIEPLKQSRAQIKLLYIGRIEPRRNVEFLFDILKNVNDKGYNAELIVIGNGDGDYEKKVFSYAENKGIMSKVHVLKQCQQQYLSQIYQMADVFLLPTKYEIFGMVLLEAMYFGNVVLTTLNGGSQMLINNDENGIIIDEFDADKWSDSVIANYNNNQMKVYAAETVKGKNTWGSVVDKFIAVYDSLLKE